MYFLRKKAHIVNERFNHMATTTVSKVRFPTKASATKRSSKVDVRLPTVEAVKVQLRSRKPLVADVASFLSYDGPEVTGPLSYREMD